MANATTLTCGSFRIEWKEGYKPTHPETHPAEWFTEDVGFTDRDRKQMAKLRVGASVDLGGPTDRVTITREA